MQICTIKQATLLFLFLTRSLAHFQEKEDSLG